MLRTRECSPSRVAVGVGMGMMPFQCQGLGRASLWVVVSVTVTLVVVSAWTVTVLGPTAAGATTSRGVLGQTTTDMVPFQWRRGVVSRPGRKGALWA